MNDSTYTHCPGCGRSLDEHADNGDCPEEDR